MTVVVTPLDTFEMLFFALFGLTHPSDLRIETAQPEWTLFLYKIVFGFYMLVSSIVLINMLIAMMSDTYQRIQVRFTLRPVVKVVLEDSFFPLQFSIGPIRHRVEVWDG